MLPPAKVSSSPTRHCSPDRLWAWGDGGVDLRGRRVVRLFLTCGSASPTTCTWVRTPTGTDNPYGARYIYPIQVGILV